MAFTKHILVMVLIVNMLWSFTIALSPPGPVINLRSCQDPGIPENARRISPQTPSFLPGMTVRFVCRFTYKLVGSENRTCLVNGSWSGVQPYCKKYMCDELDAMPPRNGKRIGKTFTIGSKVMFRCSSSYALIGEKWLTCLPNGDWSSAPPTCEHRCARVPCGVGEVCKIRNSVPKCVCRDNMECTSRWDPVCGSDGVSYINECIMKATACRARKDVYIVQHDKCLPGDRCSIIPHSNCRASFHVHFYNVTSERCQRMIAGGCHSSGWNGFFVKDDCKKLCEQDVCVLKPEAGPCDKKLERWYYDNETETCKTFSYGGCFGNPNNFRSRSDCEKRCD